METKLATLGMTQAEFGKALIENAKNHEKAKFLKDTTAEVQRLLSGIETIRTCMERDKRNLEIYEARLKAIEDGKFDLSIDWQVNGPNRKKIRYFEDRLNEAV